MASDPFRRPSLPHSFNAPYPAEQRQHSYDLPMDERPVSGLDSYRRLPVPNHVFSQQLPYTSDPEKHHYPRAVESSNHPSKALLDLATPALMTTGSFQNGAYDRGVDCSWGSDRMDCDSGDAFASSSMGQGSMPVSLSSRLGMVPSLSSSSLASTTASSSYPDVEPDLDTSLGSVSSFDLRTPLKPQQASGPDSAAMVKASFDGYSMQGAHLPLRSDSDNLPFPDDRTLPPLLFGQQQQSHPSNPPRESAMEGVMRTEAADSSSLPPSPSPFNASHRASISILSPMEQQRRQSLGHSLGLTLNGQPSTPFSPNTAHGLTSPTSSSPLSTKATELPSIHELGHAQASSGYRGIANSPNPTGKLGAGSRLKISLPPLSTQAFNRSMVQTPGGSAFSGARDGAATGAPMSPFVPPTPLCAMGGMAAARDGILGSAYVQQQQHQQRQEHVQQNKRQSLPAILPLKQSSVSMPLRSPLQGKGSSGLSPLAGELGAMSMKRQIAQEPGNAEISSKESKGSSITDGSASGSSTLLTPPYTPLTRTASLKETESGALLQRRTSTSSSSGSKKRTKDLSIGGVEMGRSVSAQRAKPSKLKTTPRLSGLPGFTIEPSSLPCSAPATQTSFSHLDKALPVTQPISAPAPLAGDLSKPSSLAPKDGAAAEYQTVSARHLANHSLHPSFSGAYTLGDELGSGGFGFVVSAIRDEDSMPVAVKFIWKDKVPAHGWVRDPELGVIPMEAFVLKVVRHQCVVKFIDLFDDPVFFYLVMELHGTPWTAAKEVGKPVSTPGNYAAGADVPMSAPVTSKGAPAAGLPSPSVTVFPPNSDIPADPATSAKALCSPEEMLSNDSMLPPSPASLTPPIRPAPMERRSSCDLFECIEQHSRLSEEQARWVFAQVVEAVWHLDRMGICHRDIKDENCVVDADFNVKLIDFGSAVITDVRKPPPYFNRFFGTMTFASSEILQGKPYRAPNAEIWSLGVLLSILLSGECPFADPSAAIRGKISKPKGIWSRDALNLLVACLDVDPDRRATISEVRDHAWVRRAWDLRGVARSDR